METKIIDGVEYIAKENVDGLIQDKISKYAKRAREAETKVEEMNERLVEAGEKMKTVDNLTEQIYGLKEELSNANSKYERHAAIASLGIQDPDVRDALEWQYQRSNTDESFGEWMNGLKENPSKAPSFLRSHFQPNEAPKPSEKPMEKMETTKETPQPKQAPKTNAKTIQSNNTETQSDILSRGLNDPDFYKQNRDAIRQAWFKQSGTKPTSKF
tara:strand:- start:25723 stop:26364 length:642 start_codon:yes stop_codon:yes gene_type:complete